MKKTMQRLLGSLSIVALAACSSSPLYYHDGQPMFIAHCKAEGWGGCLEQASKACSRGGYEVREKHTWHTHSFFSGTEEGNEIVVTCKAQSVKAGVKPTTDLP